MQRDVRDESIKNKIFVASDVMEFDYDYDFQKRSKQITAVLYGTYHNLIPAKNILSCLLTNFDRIIFITDNHSGYLKSLIKSIGKRREIEFLGWDNNKNFDIISSAHLSVILYRNKIEANYKSCNRTLISLFCGTPVVSMFNPQVESLYKHKSQDLFICKTVNDFDSQIKQALERSHSMTRAERSALREFGKHCEYGAERALVGWNRIFHNVAKA